MSVDGKKRKSIESIDQKTLKKNRQMERPNGELVMKGKLIWEKLRNNKNGKEEGYGMVEKMISLFKGKMMELASKHDASRMLQWMISSGSKDQRSVVIEELVPNVILLSKVQYGQFLVKKMIRYGSKEDKKKIVKMWKGHMVELGTHHVAAMVVEEGFEWFMPSQVSQLQLEFYGKEYCYFALEDIKNSTMLIENRPDKKAAMLEYVYHVVKKMVDKQLLGCAFVQKLCWEFMDHADVKQKLDMIDIVRDGALALISTKYGAMVVAACLKYGSVKDRKRIIKGLKGKALDACNHPSGYLVIMTLCNVVDDTVSIQKSVLAELVPHMEEIVRHATGYKVLLHLLAPLNKAYFDQKELEWMAPPMVPSKEDSSVLTVNYKKDPATRRLELLKGMQQPLLDACTNIVQKMIVNKTMSFVLLETCTQFKNQALLDALLHILQEKNEYHMHPVAHRTLQKLILISEFAFEQEYFTIVKENIWDMAQTKRGAFIVLSFLKASKSTADAVKTILASHKTELKKLAESEKGAQLILEHL